METIFSYGIESLASSFKNSPSIALGYLLSAIAFGIAVSSFAVLTLKSINFSYAQAIVDNTLSRVIIILIFVYLEIWNQWSGWFIAIGYLCGAFMIMYTYDCCLNISEYYASNVRGYYWYQVGVFSVLFIIAPLALIWKLDVYSHNILLFGLIGEIGLIILFNALGNTHFIFSVVVSITMIGTALIRNLKVSNSYIATLPLELIPLIMMAFDAEFRECGYKISEKREGNERKIEEYSKTKEVLKGCCSLLVYICLNGEEVYIEHVLGVLYILVKVITLMR